MTDEMRVKTEDNELTLAEMSAALPDTPTIMTRVGESWWHFIYAARGGNWGLAEYYLKRVRKLENTLKVLRPKHAERLERFQETALPEVWKALEAQDLARLEAAFAAATDMANRLHEESGYAYIRWELPDEAPKGLQLTAVTPFEASTDGEASGDGEGSAAQREALAEGS
jgi:hypothetical protein